MEVTLHADTEFTSAVRNYQQLHAAEEERARSTPAGDWVPAPFAVTTWQHGSTRITLSLDGIKVIWGTQSSPTGSREAGVWRAWGDPRARALVAKHANAIAITT